MLRPITGLVTGMEAMVGGRSRSIEKWHYFEKHHLGNVSWRKKAIL